MKNLLLLLVLGSGAYYFYTHPRVETRLEPVAVQAPAALPPPAAPQKLYFHSPLDAPAMSTSASTGTGYYSTDANSRFTGYQSSYSSYPAAGGYPVYVGGGGSTNNTVIINNNRAGGSAAASSATVNRMATSPSGRLSNVSRNAARSTQATTN